MRKPGLLLAVLATGCLAQPASSEPFPFKSFHVEQTSGRVVNAIMRFKVSGPSIAAQQWLLYFPYPPQLNSQKLLSFGSRDTKFYKTMELSSARREVLSSRIPVSDPKQANAISASCNYQLRLIERETASGADKAPTPLSAEERANFVRASKSYDFESPEFKTWLLRNNLLKKATERDVDFAWRAFSTIRKLYQYQYDENQNRCVSALCLVNKTDCGGLSYLFIATLRANQVPARALIGRWLKTGSEPGSLENFYGGVHVKAEFFTGEAGWVPVDLSLAVSNIYNAQIEFFGRCGSDFVTLHIDPDLEMNSIWFGAKTVHSLQNPLYWVTGTGSTGGATTECIWQTAPATPPR